MVTYIEPLNLEVWILSIFSGTPTIFGTLMVFIISAMAGYFRMNMLGLFMMLSIFILMFSGYIGASLLVVFGIIGGLIVGLTLSKILS